MGNSPQVCKYGQISKFDGQMWVKINCHFDGQLYNKIKKEELS